ncbi:MAG: hypothetical protein IPJ79_11660 [Bacteroidetes bacterium]|nr:hypothetical protein [Bacteroidota bacterium]
MEICKRRLNELEIMLNNMSNSPGQMRATISRIAVEGRSLTNILQNLRGKVENFDEWYQPKVEEMRNDTLLRFFYQLRTETLKKGDDNISGLIFSPQSSAEIAINNTGITITKELQNGERQSVFIPSRQMLVLFLWEIQLVAQAII